jgi:DNA polymerase-3 subunit delta'
VKLLPLVGHEAARRQIADAIGENRLPQTILVSGPQGVGKQRFGLWLAQRLVCTAAASTEPCGECRGCRMVLGLAHPDVHWLVPIPRPKAGEPDKQVDEAEEAIAAVLAERRGSPLYGPPDGLAGHGMATARLIARRAALTTVEGRGRVFLIGEAERLAVQDGQEDSANALLKLLEEPPAGTVFVLTAEEPGRLLPTIRSRAVGVRLGRLTDLAVRGFLEARLTPAPSGLELDERVRRAEGSIGAAIRDDAEEAAKAYRDAGAFLEAVLAGPERRLTAALSQGVFAARGAFTGMLDAMADLLGEAAREAAGGESRRPIPKGLGRRPLDALLTAQARVSAAREAAQGNVNPQLLAGVLGMDLAARL